MYHPDGMRWRRHESVRRISAAERVLDNETFTPEGQDALTLPEVMSTITAAAWSELDNSPTRSYTARDPMISSFRRNN